MLRRLARTVLRRTGYLSPADTEYLRREWQGEAVRVARHYVEDELTHAEGDVATRLRLLSHQLMEKEGEIREGERVRAPRRREF